LALSSRVYGICIGIHQTRWRNWHGITRNRSGGHHILIFPNVVRRRISRGVAARNTVPIGIGVRPIALCVLHLDYQEEIPRRDGGSTTNTCIHRDRRRASGNRCPARVIRVHNPRNGCSSIFPGCGAICPRFHRSRKKQSHRRRKAEKFSQTRAANQSVR